MFGPPDGYPIVLAHGFTCAIRVRGYQIADLAADYRVIASTIAAMGAAAFRAAAGIASVSWPPTFNAVLEVTLGPGERAVLAGHSMGGIAITAWSDRYRHKVRRRADAVALINTTTGDLVRKVICCRPAAVRGGPRPGRPTLDHHIWLFRDAERDRVANARVGRDAALNLRPVCGHRAGRPRRLRGNAGRRVGAAAHQPSRPDRAHSRHWQRT